MVVDVQNVPADVLKDRQNISNQILFYWEISSAMTEGEKMSGFTNSIGHIG